MGAPCSWTIDEDAGTRCGCAGGKCWTGYSPAVRARASALAAHWMWAATGRRYGLCEVSVLPCNPGPVEPLYQEYGLAGSPGGVDIIGGQWRNVPCGGGCSCSATAPCEVELPGPVDSITEVLVDCALVSPDAYRVYGRRLLTRLDGECWPSCQSYASEFPAFEVIYMRGVAVPDHIQYAYETLACQLAKACNGAEDCALPQRMRTLTRQGVTLEVATEEAQSVGGKLRTGIKAVDDVVAADNPYGLTERPRVSSPDLPGVRVATWTGGS